MGLLRRHADPSVSELSQRIVAVWKRQLAEETAQKHSTAKQHASAAGFGGGAARGGGGGGARRR